MGPLDVPDLVVCFGDGCRGLPDALPSLCRSAGSAIIRESSIPVATLQTAGFHDAGLAGQTGRLARDKRELL